ncbi:MAG: BA14K family protein, partial [Rhizobiaceae bacterium]|nr:BA14K family protein [Rhizobiaceae bacterium]
KVLFGVRDSARLRSVRYPTGGGGPRERRPTRSRVSREARPGQRHGKRERAPVRLETLRNSDAPKVITYNETASIEPWSTGWQDYCSTKYRSFNSKTGTFLGYDGDRHFCVAK